MTGSVQSTTACEEMRLLVQADLDGELDAAATAALAAHLAECPGCAALRQELTGLSARLKRELPPYAAPASLRRSLEARLLPAAAAPPAPSGFRRRMVPLASFGAGAAIAACLALLLLPTTRPDADAELVADHIRALQPGHLTDVLSSDQHTVKPWFDGRIDYSPPVKDFVSEGFPLLGGRLDYVHDRPVAVLAYRRAKHLIDLYVWPEEGPASTPAVETRNGYNIVRWRADGMAFSAVSDVELAQLQDFVELWRR